MSSNNPKYERYETRVKHLHDELQRARQGTERRDRGHSPSRTNRHSHDRSISPTGHTETASERYHRKKEKHKYTTEIRNKKYASVIDKEQQFIPAMSVDVNVWYEDAGVKHERSFIIELAKEDIIGSPRPDELLSTKLKEKIPFESWLSLSVKVDDQFRQGRMEPLYDRKFDTEEEVDDDLKLEQEDMWNRDPEGKYNTKMVCVLKRMPPVRNRLNFLDSVPTPTKHSDVRLLLKALQIL